MSKVQLHLASSSARRRDILDTLGIRFTWKAVDIDESPLLGESVQAMTARLAAAKAAASGTGRGHPILAADTVVAIEDRILGKPASCEQALDMLSMLSGRTHKVVTSVALQCNTRLLHASSQTNVTFRHISRDEALAYWQSGEPAGKAGAYAVQGIGGIFVSQLSGSFTGVVGLPVFETSALLREAGIDPLGEGW